MSIAFREGLKIPAPALNDIILAANQDIRQVRVHTDWCYTCMATELSLLDLLGPASVCQH